MLIYMDRSEEKENIRTKFWRENLNYKILKWSNKPNCIVFISSAGLDLSLRDFYEWNMVSQRREIKKRFGKCIFVRDPFASFYVNGLNEDIKSIDLIIDFIRKETAGLNVVLAGYSAGAYLGLILASSMPNVSRVLAFSAVANLYLWVGENGDESVETNEHLRIHASKSTYSKYYDIAGSLRNVKCDTLYFYPSNSSLDVVQKNVIVESGNENIISVGFCSNKHSLTVNHIDHVHLICSDKKHIKKIKRKFNTKENVNPTRFSLYNLGLFYFKEQFLRLVRSFKRFIHRFSN